MNVFKRLGRVTNIHKSKLKKNDVKIIVGVDTISVYFDKDVDLIEQKSKIADKVNGLIKKVEILNGKLKNKSFLDNAPTLIVQKEKKKGVKKTNPS